MGCKFSIITSKKPLSKGFSSDGQGGLLKRPGGLMTSGVCATREVDGPAQFASFLGGLGPDQALMCGMVENAYSGRPIKSRKEAGPGDATRTRESVDWPKGSGIFGIDHDPEPGKTLFSREDLLKALSAACPALPAAPMVHVYSASGFILNAETVEELKGQGGQHVYACVKDARDIPRAGKVLYDRLWLAGYGRFDVSKSGSLLNRNLVDGSVWQPERLFFTSGAVCEWPIVQQRPPFVVLNPDAEALDTSVALPDLNQEEQERLAVAQAEARKAAASKAAEVRKAWCAERMVEYRERHAAEIVEAMPDATLERQFIRAVEDRELPPDFVLHMQGGAVVTVRELLNNPKGYHGARCGDPLEPGYGNDDRIARIDLTPGRRPAVYSHAHGGVVYRLLPCQEVVDLQDGDLPAVVSRCEEALGRHGDVYQRGDQLVRLAGDAVVPIRPALLRNYLETVVRFEKLNLTRKKIVPKDCPEEVATRLIEMRGMRPHVPKLRGVVNGPILRLDGSLLASVGYDPDTGLVLLGDEAVWPFIPSAPSREQVRAALDNLMEPFQFYNFGTPTARGTMLALMLTVILRPILPTAPGFAFDSSVAGSGKTKACVAVSWLSGSPAKASPWSDKPEEQQKNLIATFRSSPSVVIFDNIVRSLESAALCAALTSEYIEDRLLGSHDRVAVPTNSLLLFSGNNLGIVGDLGRRILRINIDPECECPEARSFPFDPVERLRERWPVARAAALTVLRGFFAAGAPMIESGGVGSFEDWNRMVRQAVCWVGSERLCEKEIGDPADSIKINREDDPEVRRLSTMLTACRSIFGDVPKRAADIVEWTLFDEVSEDPSRSEVIREAQEALRSVLPEIATGQRTGTVSAQRLGIWLSRNKGRIVDGLRFEQSGNLNGSLTWVVRWADGDSRGLGVLMGLVQPIAQK